MPTYFFLFCLVGAPPGGDSNLWFFFLGFLLEPNQRPLAGQTLIQNFNQLFRYQNTCIKQVSPKTKNLQMKNQRFQFWRLSADYDIICQAWPSQARSSQILAIKKAKLLNLLPPSIRYGGPYKKNNRGASGPTRSCLKNSDSKFFAYLFLLSHRFCSGR